MKRRKMAIFADVKQEVIQEEPENTPSGSLEEDVDVLTSIGADDEVISVYTNDTIKITAPDFISEEATAIINTLAMVSAPLIEQVKEYEIVVVSVSNPEVIHEDIIIPFDIADFQLSAPTEIKVEPILAADIELEKDKKQKQKLKEEEEESRMNLKITTPPTMRLLALREIKPLAYAALRKDDSLTFAGALAKVSKELGFANYEFYVVDYCNSKSA